MSGSDTAAARETGAEVAIIGLGVIGGSVALRLRQRGTSLAAFTISDGDRALAEAAGLSVARTIADAVRGAGLVLIAVPVDAIAAVAAAVVGAVPATATLLHAGSLQRPAALAVEPGIAARLIGTHPLAGSHRAGFAAASPDLYRGATVFVERRAGARQREDAELLWSLAGAGRVEYVDADAHDAAMSWASHLPQLASTALAATLADVLGDERAPSIVPHGGPGARDATRLAMSALDVWQPILERAPASTLAALRAFEQRVGALRSGLERQQWDALRETWEQAVRWRARAEPGERA